jgi:hypothetical protein
MGEGLGAVNFGKMLTLNETASWLWQKAKEMGDFTVEMLSDALCEEFDVSAEEARKDVTDIIASWQELELVE